MCFRETRFMRKICVNWWENVWRHPICVFFMWRRVETSFSTSFKCVIHEKIMLKLCGDTFAFKAKIVTAHFVRFLCGRRMYVRFLCGFHVETNRDFYQMWELCGFYVETNGDFYQLWELCRFYVETNIYLNQMWELCGFNVETDLNQLWRLCWFYVETNFFYMRDILINILLILFSSRNKCGFYFEITFVTLITL